MTTTRNKTHWRIPATQLARAAGKTPIQIAAYDRIYVIADFSIAQSTFSLVLETVTGLAALNSSTVNVAAKEIIIFTADEVRQYLTNAGAVLPTPNAVYFHPKGLRGNLEDEIVVLEDTVVGRI